MQRTWVNHNDIMLVLAVQITDQGSHLIERKAFCQSEDFEAVHVVDVYLCQAPSSVSREWIDLPVHMVSRGMFAFE